MTPCRVDTDRVPGPLPRPPPPTTALTCIRGAATCLPGKFRREVFNGLLIVFRYFLVEMIMLTSPVVFPQSDPERL